MTHAITVALIGWLASTCACACADETQQRPATAAMASPTPSPLPLPANAFHSDEAESRLSSPPPPTSPTSPSSPSSPSRFDTRRIGASDGDGDGDGSASRFHGAPVDLDLKSADLANVFRLLADVGHVNIVVAGEVTGTVTLRLKHVPWDQALDLVARTHGLELRREGNVILVGVRGRQAGGPGAGYERSHAGFAAARAIGDP